jgi:hypothetical protein
MNILPISIAATDLVSVEAWWCLLKRNAGEREIGSWCAVSIQIYTSVSIGKLDSYGSFLGGWT